MATIATNGASWNASDNTVTVDFNQPYLDGVLLPGDVVVVPENPNNPTPLLSDPNYVDTSTDTYSSIQVSNPPLAPGVYDIVLQADPYSTESVWSMNGPLTLGTFTILPPAATPLPATLSTAASLGTVGPQMQSIAGTLDLASQQNVDLYQITLGPGHFWRLGVQLEAQQIGSPLQGALSLFDSNGNVLATSNSGTGGLNSPADPYLFSGLSRGVYYVGVSGANNIPGQPGGYDPRGSGRFGTSGDQQAGGNYTLDLFADQADTPTEVLGAELQWGDPLGPSPTGLTLDFSNSIDINSLNAAMTIPSAFVVVDQSGHLWSLSPTPYNAGNAQLNLVFAQPLPAGQYRLLNSSSDGLKDLAGWSPVCAGIAARDPCNLDSSGQHSTRGSGLSGYSLALTAKRGWRFRADPPGTDYHKPGVYSDSRFLHPRDGFTAGNAGGRASGTGRPRSYRSREPGCIAPVHARSSAWCLLVHIPRLHS